MNFIKELFVAHYDPNLDKIVGCKKGSIVWYHEHRHQQQYSNKIVNVLNVINAWLTQVSTAFAILGLADRENLIEWFALATFFMLPYFFETLIYELDAWMYAYRKMEVKK